MENEFKNKYQLIYFSLNKSQTTQNQSFKDHKLPAAFFMLFFSQSILLQTLSWHHGFESQ